MEVGRKALKHVPPWLGGHGTGAALGAELRGPRREADFVGRAHRVRGRRATNRLQVGFGEHRMLVRNLSARSGKGLTFSSTPKAPKVGHGYPCLTATQGSS